MSLNEFRRLLKQVQKDLTGEPYYIRELDEEE